MEIVRSWIRLLDVFHLPFAFHILSFELEKFWNVEEHREDGEGQDVAEKRTLKQTKNKLNFLL
jgi:hypothetical protein